MKTTDVTRLAGRNVRLWPDHDAPGRSYMRLFGARARSRCRPRRRRGCCGQFPKGWDLADALRDGITDATIRHMLNTARPIDPARAKSLLRDPRRHAAARRLLGYTPATAACRPMQ